MRKKVYLFACIEKNIGDDLFVYSVCKRYPQTTFVISADAAYLELNDIPNLEYSEKLKHWLGYANNESTNFIRRIAAALIERYYRAKLQKLDSIYIVGNAFKNMDYKGHYQIRWLERRLLLSKSFYLLSTNYGPSNDNNWAKDCKMVFEKMDDVCFRDVDSYELFRDLKNVRYAPDAVITLGNKDMNEIGRPGDAFLLLGDKYVVISVIDCLMSGRSKKLKDAANEYENKMAYLVDCFNKDGIGVVLVNSNTKQDRPASERIYERCAHKSKVLIFDYDGNIQNVFKVFESAKAVIATRLHTIILGWLNNVPVIPIVYDIKVERLLKSYGFDEFKKEIIDLENFDYNSVKVAIDEYSFKLSKDIIDAAEDQFRLTDKLLGIGEYKIEK